MNDRVSEELLAEAAGRAAAGAVAKAGGALITAEYEGRSYSFRADGWFNATQAAKRYGNDVHEWVRLPETKRYLAALERTYGKIPYVETSRARADRGGGTWLHPKLAVRFSRWLDVDFEIWCDMQIEKILRGELSVDQLSAQLSNADERRILHHAAYDIAITNKVLISTAHILHNAAAGTDHYDEMTRGGVERAALVSQRFISRTATARDFALLEASKRGLEKAQQQLTLDLLECDGDLECDKLEIPK